jgi:hypothetical protein
MNNELKMMREEAVVASHFLAANASYGAKI